MPVRGSVEFKFRVDRDRAELASAELSAAGFITRVEDTDPDQRLTVVVGRYLGVRSPDAELQQAHHDAAQALLTRAGIDNEPGGMAVVIEGNTNAAFVAGMLHRTSEGSRVPVNQSADQLPFLGTCFALWHTNTLVTAAHCVNGVAASELRVHFPHAAQLSEVDSVAQHPDADLAVVHLGKHAWPENVEPFLQIDSQSSRAPGADFLAYGFPENVIGMDAREPTARLFKGHYQRLFQLKSHQGYRYLAGELSIPVPVGLSGGPLFHPSNHSVVSAVAVENHESYTLVGGFEEERSEGGVHRVEQRHVVQYGIAVMLDPVMDWLEDLIEPGARYP